jgi:hypothetical protein
MMASITDTRDPDNPVEVFRIPAEQIVRLLEVLQHPHLEGYKQFIEAARNSDWDPVLLDAQSLFSAVRT